MSSLCRREDEAVPSCPALSMITVRPSVAPVETPRIPANVDHVSNLPRQTALSLEKAEVNTVEHLLAALSGLGVDNLVVEMNGPEVPGGDGSSKVFVDAILESGMIDQKTPRRSFTLDESICISEGGGTIVALPPESGVEGPIAEVRGWGFDEDVEQHRRIQPTAERNDVAPGRSAVGECFQPGCQRVGGNLHGETVGFSSP